MGVQSPIHKNTWLFATRARRERWFFTCFFYIDWSLQAPPTFVSGSLSAHPFYIDILIERRVSRWIHSKKYAGSQVTI